MLLEILLSIFPHPTAFILAIVNLAGRADLSLAAKVIWIIICVFWGIGPILYALIGGGNLL